MVVIDAFGPVTSASGSPEMADLPADVRKRAAALSTPSAAPGQEGYALVRLVSARCFFAA